MKSIIILVACLLFTWQKVCANQLIIDIPEYEKLNDITDIYKCGDETLEATYYRLLKRPPTSEDDETISLIKLKLKDKIVIGGLIPSAYGIKFSGDKFTWWSKGSWAEYVQLSADGKVKNTYQCIIIPR